MRARKRAPPAPWYRVLVATGVVRHHEGTVKVNNTQRGRGRERDLRDEGKRERPQGLLPLIIGRAEIGPP